MIAALGRGEIPDTAELKARFKLAVIKKNGVLQQPFLCRSNDPKINPPARDLLWAAIVLEDRTGIATVSAIITAELLDRGGKRNNATPLTAEFIGELLDLAPDRKFRQVLQDKADRTRGVICSTD